MKIAPGKVRDAIVSYLDERGDEASVHEIELAVTRRLGEVPGSSVRSFLRLHVGDVLERLARGKYRLKKICGEEVASVALAPPAKVGLATLYHADCFAWLQQQADCSIQSVVTDPPYGAHEYSANEIERLRSGHGGGIWRVPPSFDGHRRAPLPRFTTMSAADRVDLYAFFRRLGVQLARVVVPGANVVIASNPLLSHIVTAAMAEAGLEPRGYLARLTMTMRGGDRPKNAHDEFDGVSVMPRSQWEPWVVLRRPLDGRVQDNLRRWGTGGFRRPSSDRPFGDVIRSAPTNRAERAIAPHPSLKPQAFLRQLVRGVLPLGTGTVLDPFAGSGSTLAAANAIGYCSMGVEADAKFFRLAANAIPSLAAIKTIEPT